MTVPLSACGGRLGKRSARRGMLLLVVLVIISVLAVIGASFSFRMSSQLTSVNSQQQEQQARWAAESGIDRVITLLREQRNDLDQWYNNSRSFRRILVWAPDKIGGSESLADQEPIPGRPAWRFSIVSYKVEGETAKIRYGITDEAGKINLNTASRMQLLAFFDQLDLKEAAEVTSEQLTDALIDWRDKDDTPISPNGAESGYYNTLDPPYKAKNKPLETTEELLMVKGFNGRILYGEDYNRNGYLDANEDDGPEGAFPPDNGDGILDRGILPYVTVYSWDWNLCNDNKRRVDMNLTDFSKLDKLPEHIQAEINPDILKFITDAKKRGYKFKSVGDLVDLQVYEDGTSNHDKAWKQFVRKLQQAGRVQPTDEQQANEDNTADQTGGDNGEKSKDDEKSKDKDKGKDSAGDSKAGKAKDGKDNNAGSDSGDPKNSERDDGSTPKKKNDRNNQNIRPRRNSTNEEEKNPHSGNSNSGNNSGSGDSKSGSGSSGDSTNSGKSNSGSESDSKSGNGDAKTGDSKNNDSKSKDGSGDTKNGDKKSGDKKGGTIGGKDNSTTDGTKGGSKTPDEMDNEDDADANGNNSGSGNASGNSKGTPLPNPVTAQDLPVLVDRLSTISMPSTAGLINVNTASLSVLSTIPGLTQQDAEAIVAKREQLAGTDKSTTAWLVTSGALDPLTFALVCNQITSRSIQFTIDAIGFADHVGAYKRIQAVVEMRGQLSQIKYYRDISSLGIGFPVQDDQRRDGFAFSD